MLRNKITNFKINDEADYLLLQIKKKTFTRILFIYLKIDDKKKEKIKKMWSQQNLIKNIESEEIQKWKYFNWNLKLFGIQKRISGFNNVNETWKKKKKQEKISLMRNNNETKQEKFFIGGTKSKLAFKDLKLYKIILCNLNGRTFEVFV